MGSVGGAGDGGDSPGHLLQVGDEPEGGVDVRQVEPEYERDGEQPARRARRVHAIDEVVLKPQRQTLYTPSLCTGNGHSH